MKYSRVPVRDITSVKIESHGSSLARLQPDFLESTESLDGSRGLIRDLWEAEV